MFYREHFKLEKYDPNTNFHKNTSSRCAPIVRENCADTMERDIGRVILLRGFSFITFLETCTSKILGDLEQCKDKTLILLYMDKNKRDARVR